VALVEPGIIDTDMARDIAGAASPIYPHARRIAALFAASLTKPTGPEVVADKICEIVTGDTWQLRHPVGPGAEAVINFRLGMSVESWIDRGAVDDEAWFDMMQRERGVDLRGMAR
jgi:hypothetical protein